LEKKIEELLELQEQYKSREVAMTRSLEESGEKVTQLSDSVALFKSIIPDTKKAIALAEKSIDMLENKCRQLEDIISAKDRKIIALADKISSYTRYSDINIEPEIYSSTKERKLWVERHSESEYDLEVWKKYAFRLTSSIALRGGFYSLARVLFSRIWSQLRCILCGCSRGTVKSKTMNFFSHNALSIILITLRQSLAY
jgi:archaellum component FlaC